MRAALQTHIMGAKDQSHYQIFTRCRFSSSILYFKRLVVGRELWQPTTTADLLQDMNTGDQCLRLLSDMPEWKYTRRELLAEMGVGTDRTTPRINNEPGDRRTIHINMDLRYDRERILQGNGHPQTDLQIIKYKQTGNQVTTSCATMLTSLTILLCLEIVSQSIYASYQCNYLTFRGHDLYEFDVEIWKIYLLLLARYESPLHIAKRLDVNISILLTCRDHIFPSNVSLQLEDFPFFQHRLRLIQEKMDD